MERRDTRGRYELPFVVERRVHRAVRHLHLLVRVRNQEPDLPRAWYVLGVDDGEVCHFDWLDPELGDPRAEN